MRLISVPLLALCITAVIGAQPLQTRAAKFPPPANDMFTNAQVQTGYGWYAYGETRGATHEKGDAGQATVWYSWTAPASGPALVNLWDQIRPFGSFNVLTGTNVTKLKAVKPLVKRNRFGLLFAAEMGTTYYFDINKPSGFKLDQASDFTLQLTLITVAITQPTNNLVFSASDTIPLAMVTTEDPSMVSNVTFIASGQTIAVFDSPPYSGIWTNPIPGNWQIYAELTRTDGYVLDTTRRNITVRPHNDNFANREVLVGTNINIYEPGDAATLEPGEPAANVNGSVWYTWTAPGDGYVVIPHYYPPFVGPLNVFTGDSLASLTQLTTQDHAGNDIPFHVSAGETLQIAVFSGNLSLTFYGIPENDSFATPIALEGTNTGFAGSSLAASSEPGETVASYAAGHSVWYTWTAPTNGDLILEDTNSGIISTDGSKNSPLVVTTFTGDDVTNLTAISTNGLGQPAHISVLAGTSYHIAIDNYTSDKGVAFFGVQLTFASAQPNDNFADAIELTGEGSDFIYTTVGASTEPGEPDQGPNSLWWTWTAPHDGTVLVSGVFYTSARGHAYTGNSLTNLTLVGSDDQAYFLWNVQAATTYQIAISSGWPGKVFQAGLRLQYYTNGTIIEP